MKFFKAQVGTACPDAVKSFLSSFDGQPVNKQTIREVDAEVTSLVCEFRFCHGNTNRDGSAWFAHEDENGQGWGSSLTIINK